MRFVRYRPAPPLDQHIEVLWYAEGDGATTARKAPPRLHDGMATGGRRWGDHQFERLLPSGESEIVINLRDDSVRVYSDGDSGHPITLTGAVLCGPHTRPFIIDTAEQDDVMGVHFRAGGAASFFRAPLSEMQNQHVQLPDLWGSWSAHIRDRLLSVTDLRQKFLVLEQLLLKLLGPKGNAQAVVSYSVARLSNRPSSFSVADLVEETGFSQRHLTQIFLDTTGISPKRFQRLQRFQRVLCYIHSLRGASDSIAQEPTALPVNREIDWADMAVIAGYYDQAHLIHEFREFSSTTPTAYAALPVRNRNHVPLFL